MGQKALSAILPCNIYGGLDAFAMPRSRLGVDSLCVVSFNYLFCMYSSDSCAGYGVLHCTVEYREHPGRKEASDERQHLLGLLLWSQTWEDE